jgi:chromosome partitioning protein
MQALSLVNQKGGCGKTTSAIHLGAALVRCGARVLLVDLDPQAHATLGLGCEAEGGPSAFDVLARGVPAREALREASGGLSLLPASARLGEFEEASSQALRPERRLRRALAPLAAEFDYALLDCPPRADGVLTANALAATTVAVLVVETGAFALQGALRALALVEQTARAQGSRFDVRVLATLFDRRTRFDREVLVALQARFGALLYETAVRRDVRLREATACGRPVQEIAPRCRATIDFAALAAEVQAQRLSSGRPLGEDDARPDDASLDDASLDEASLDDPAAAPSLPSLESAPAARPDRRAPLRPAF